MADTHSLAVGIILYPGFDTLDVMGPVELLSVPVVASKFKLILMSLDGQAVTSAAGIRVVPDSSCADHLTLDVLLVPGNVAARSPKRSALQETLASTGRLCFVLNSSLVTGEQAAQVQGS
ncbi:hypothetical protein ABBQ32_013124 [Trebouxia sp. C0010 RCD-2024]